MAFFKLGKLELLGFVLGILCVGLSIFGAVRAYTPIPISDMWDGYINFYIKLTSGDNLAWLSQHNEHRLLLPRLFFWLDLRFFSGTVAFLIVTNFILIALCGLIFIASWNELYAKNNILVPVFIVSWLFSWAQEDNLTWGFQCQFIMAFLLPLAAFYFLYKSTCSHRSMLFFSIATCCGILSIGTMANGILALPLLTFLSLLLRLSWKKTTILFLFAAALSTLYFFGYVAPKNHGTFFQTIARDSINLIQYVLLYIGNPFYYFLGKNSFSVFFAKTSALLLICGVCCTTFYYIKRRAVSSLQLTMLVFTLFVFLTAIGTAGGRLIFGVNQALESRYVTPALMVWMSFFVICAPFIKRLSYNVVCCSVLISLILILPLQFKALKSKSDMLFERRVAALALELGVKDSKQIIEIYPSLDWLFPIAIAAKQQKISIFGQSPLVGLKQELGHSLPIHDHTISNNCSDIALDEEIIESEPSFVRVQGHLNKNDTYEHNILTFTDNLGNVVGFAYCSDGAVSKKLATHGCKFKGYIHTNITPNLQAKVFAGKVCNIHSLFSNK